MALVALVFFLLVQVPTPNPRSAISGPPPATRVISFRTDASPEEIQAAGAELLESYGAFAVARGGEGSLALVKAQGRYANPLEGSSTLQLLGGIVDLATLVPRPASDWPIDSRGETVGVVHLHAPIKAEWKDALQALGLQVLRYLPLDPRANPIDPDEFPRRLAHRRVHRSGLRGPRLERRNGLGNPVQFDGQLSLLVRRPRWDGPGGRDGRHGPRLRRQFVPPIVGFHRLRGYLQHDGSQPPQGHPLREHGRPDGTTHVARWRWPMGSVVDQR